MVQIPTPKVKSKGGIELPEHTQEQQKSRFMYGRLLSLGLVAREKLGGALDDYAIFDPNGKIDIELDPVEKSGIASLHWSQVLAFISKQALDEMQLPTE